MDGNATYLPEATITAVRARVLSLFALATLSMFSFDLVRQLVPRTHSATWTPVLIWLTDLAPLILTVVWAFIFMKTYRLAGVNRRRTLYLLLLVPFVLAYPAWMAIVVVCGTFFNWCGGQPL